MTVFDSAQNSVVLFSVRAVVRAADDLNPRGDKDAGETLWRRRTHPSCIARWPELRWIKLAPFGPAKKGDLEVVMSTVRLETRPSRMGVLHAVAVGAATLGFLFVLLWASEALGIGPSTDALMRALASSAREASLQALIRGLPVALAFGALGGAMLALFASLFRFLDRREEMTS